MVLSGSAKSAGTVLWTMLVLLGASARAGTLEIRARTGKRSGTIRGGELRPRDYWRLEGEMLGLMQHFDIPEDELQPKGKVLPYLRKQQRYHPYTGVRWGERQPMPANRSWPPLPGDLTWRTVFAGCKEVKRAAWRRVRQTPDSCSIYILDASDVAERVGVPRCDVHNFAIDPRKSMILPNPAKLPFPLPEQDSRIQNAHEMYPWKVGPHYLAQSGGAYYFMKALQNSTFVSHDIDTADAVFVYDYCYMIWSLSESHATRHWWLNTIARYRPNPHVIEYVHRIYDDILGSARYNRMWGKDYIWWLPHTAVFSRDDIFGKEPINQFFQEKGCNLARGGLYLAPTVYMRWRCTLYHPERLLVVPQASMDVVAWRKTERPTFIYFKANCEQPDYYSVGKYMRSLLAQTLARVAEGAADLRVQCLDTVIGSAGYNEESHAQLMKSLFRSVFCPVIPGDSQTSQHLTERYIAGCIPVFVGPPFHTMPFEKEVDYSRSAVFLNVTNSEEWMRDVVMEWEFPMIPSEGWDHELMGLHPELKESESPKWWFPWISVDALHTIDKLEDIIAKLRSFPPRRIKAMQQAVKRERTKFIYAWGRGGKPGALDIIVDNICHFVGKGCGPFNATA